MTSLYRAQYRKPHHSRPHYSNNITTTRVRISAWPYLKDVSSWIYLHYTFGGRSTDLAYHVHKSGRKTSIINHPII